MSSILFFMMLVFLMSVLYADLIVGRAEYQKNVIQRVVWAITGEAVAFNMVMMGMAIFLAGLMCYLYFERAWAGVLFFMIIEAGWVVVWPRRSKGGGGI